MKHEVNFLTALVYICLLRPSTAESKQVSVEVFSFNESCGKYCGKHHDEQCPKDCKIPCVRIPSVVRLGPAKGNSTTLVAVAECRFRDVGDDCTPNTYMRPNATYPDYIDLCSKISNDGGLTWGPIQRNITKLPWWNQNPTMVYDEIRGRILMHFSRLSMQGLRAEPNQYEHWVTISKDGYTWEKPLLLDQQLKRLSPPAYLSKPGPGTLTLLKVGAYAGRIIVPIYFNHCAGLMQFDCAAAIYTDDGGYDGVYKSSILEQALAPFGMAGMSESVAVEAPSGAVILNMRAGGWSGDDSRGVVVSDNGGEIFGPVMFDSHLFDPGSIDGCQASLIRPENGGGEMLYFANPHNRNWRENMTILRANASKVPVNNTGYAEYDWKVVATGLDYSNKLNDYTGGAYSCLVELAASCYGEARIGYLYEQAKQNCSGHACSIRFAVLDHQI
jgi:hypothetical protein